MTSPGFTYPRSARVRTRADYACAFDGGRRLHDNLLQLVVKPDPSPGAVARLGLAVSRKVDPDAVGRNYIRRTLKDAFRHSRRHLAPGSYVVVAKPAARDADGIALRAAFARLLQRAGALSPSSATGTMPAQTSSPPDPDALPDGRAFRAG